MLADASGLGAAESSAAGMTKVEVKRKGRSELSQELEWGDVTWPG